MHFPHLLLASILSWQTVRAVVPLVHLDYTSYHGTALQNGITQWLGIRYAAPPVGDLRFREPQDPVVDNSIIEADAHGPICLGTNSGPPTDNMQEDCLFLNVYAPSNTSNKKLPVFFFIQGGGFNTNSNANYNGSGLIEAGDRDLIVVNFNYRVGPYGFLASEEVLADGSVNNGLKDQRKALYWVQKYIHLFGGDPGHVTLGGASAGAASINLQSTAYGGRNDNLFHATAAESQSFAAIRTIPESQYQYDRLVARANCTPSSSSYRPLAANTITCLRQLPASALQAINTNIPSPNTTNPPLYMYNPVLDADFLRKSTLTAYTAGNFLQLPSLSGSTSNEGTIFTPRNTSNLDQAKTFIRDQFPLITPAQLDLWGNLYPVGETPEFPDSGRYWRQLSNGYGELRYTCPALSISEVYAAHGVNNNWHYLWNVYDPAAAEEGYGVSHTIETNAIFGPSNTHGSAPASYYPGGLNAHVVTQAQAYWSSFIRSFDPNTFTSGFAGNGSGGGSVKWRPWSSGEGGFRRLVFGTDGTDGTDGTGMEAVDGGLRGRCDVLSGWGVGIGQ